MGYKVQLTSPVTKVMEFCKAAGFRIERGGQKMNYFWAHSEITPTWLVQTNSWSLAWGMSTSYTTKCSY